MAQDVKTEDRVGSILTKDVLTVDSSETLRSALKKMHKEDVGSLVVMEAGKAAGMISERNITRLAAETNDPRWLEAKTKTVMSTPLIAVEPETPIIDALEIMLRKHIRRLPVTKNNELRGIITESDIVVWVLKITYEPDIPEHLKELVNKIERLERI
jgi:CBS domain-containing protein